MCFTDLSIFFQGYVLRTTAYILNRVPSKSMPKTPYEIQRRKKSNLKYLKVWGYPAYVKRYFKHKLSARADKCLFVGYPKESIRYLFYHPTEHKVFVSKYATFMEKEFILERGSGKKIKLGEVQDLQMQAQDDPQSKISINEVQP